MPIAKQKTFFLLLRVNKQTKNKWIFIDYNTIFCSRNDAMGKDLQASDLDGIVNELLLLEEWHWTPLLAAGEQQKECPRTSTQVNV